jgi:hypothetical protein
MAKYFNFFPRTVYTVESKTNSLETVTNITSRFAFEQGLKDNSAAFYEYDIKESDTPEIIASKFYGNPERHWIVLLFNDIIDPQFDWPLSFNSFNEYVDKKYSAPQYANTANTMVSGLSFARSEDKSYYKVITVVSPSDGVTTTKEIEIDEAQYINVAASSVVYQLENNTTITETISKKTKTFYDYENELNDKKRKIKLLKSEFVPAIEKEFKRVVKQ